MKKMTILVPLALLPVVAVLLFSTVSSAQDLPKADPGKAKANAATAPSEEPNATPESKQGERHHEKKKRNEEKETPKEPAPADGKKAEDVKASTQAAPAQDSVKPDAPKKPYKVQYVHRKAHRSVKKANE